MTQTPDTPTIGQALVAGLKARGVDTVFGIPGVHTIELYRGLAGSGIRHITPRHEAGAAFMADGYARVSGKPGVAFVITGPGVANTLTPMGQARADSVPILVVSGVNARPTLGLGMGHLHELPDQRAMVASVALSATRIEAASDLVPTLDQAFDLLEHGRGGPVHIEVPTDVMPAPCPADLLTAVRAAPRPGLNRAPDTAQFEQAAQMLRQARAPIILVGGGARYCGDLIAQLANHISAPVMQTANARGMMHGHPLALPASPCLDSVRALI
ncbi:MAG: thiamine pyrophosphate-binding protein, partial [Paracoccaceae bacterium]|nr:thiamine pyrophosphate-binding protein [Paracoccaceae bacterium]